MNKIFTYMLAGAFLLLFSRCDSLELGPTSSISDSNYWKSEAHFSAFNAGVHALFRERTYSFFLLGEPRANIYSGSDSFGGEAAQGNSRLPQNALNKDNVGVSNYGELYQVINQINLMIAKTTETSVLSDAAKKYYLGEAHGMRAFLYFQLLRSWGAVVMHQEYTSGSSLDLGNLAKPVSSETEIMAFIKADIQASEDAFGNNYAFQNKRNYWSLPATKMLKGEVYLWSGTRMGGGNGDVQTAKTAFTEVKNADVQLVPEFKKVFAYDNKLNKEVIFTIHNGKDEYNLWNDSWRANMIPQQLYMPNFCNADGVSFKLLPESQLNGMIRFQLQDDLYHKIYCDGDTRRDACLTPVYKKTDGVVEYVSCFAFKFQGTLLEGGSQRSFLEDFPIYRYSDCLLQLAQAKALLGEDPSSEINAVRERAYGTTYFAANRTTLAYPNDNQSTITYPIVGDVVLYASNKYIKPDNAGALEAVLKERLRELMFEGKRWYDIRLLGWDYVKTYSSLTDENKQLWPINQDVMTNNPAVDQTPGYEK